MFRRQLKMLVFAASLAGMTGIMSAGAESPSAADAAGINLSEWGREAVLPEWSASAEIRGAESNPPDFDDFLSGEIETDFIGDEIRGLHSEFINTRQWVDSDIRANLAHRWETIPNRLAERGLGFAESELESLSWIPNVDLAAESDSAGRLAGFSAGGTGLLWTGESAAVGFQPWGRWTDGGENDAASFGVFSRRALGDWAVVGGNVFADYAASAEFGDFARWSAGLDFQSPLGELRGNYYAGLSSTRERVGLENRVLAYAPSGVDAELRLRWFGGSEWSGFAEYEKWEGQFGDSDLEEVGYGLSFRPAGGGLLAGLQVDAGYRDSEEWNLRFGYFRTLGADNSVRSSGSAFAVRSALIAPVAREREIRVAAVTVQEKPFSAKSRFLSHSNFPRIEDERPWIATVYSRCSQTRIQTPNPALGDLGTVIFAAARDESRFDDLCDAIQMGGDVDHRGEFNASPLHRAVSGMAVDNLRLLIAAGADVNLQNRNGVTPLGRAQVLAERTDDSAELAILQTLAILLIDSGGKCVKKETTDPLSLCNQSIGSLRDGWDDYDYGINDKVVIYTNHVGDIYQFKHPRAEGATISRVIHSHSGLEFLADGRLRKAEGGRLSRTFSDRLIPVEMHDAETDSTAYTLLRLQILQAVHPEPVVFSTIPKVASGYTGFVFSVTIVPAVEGYFLAFEGEAGDQGILINGSFDNTLQLWEGIFQTTVPVLTITSRTKDFKGIHMPHGMQVFLQRPANVFAPPVVEINASITPTDYADVTVGFTITLSVVANHKTVSVSVKPGQTGSIHTLLADFADSTFSIVGASGPFNVTDEGLVQLNTALTVGNRRQDVTIKATAPGLAGEIFHVVQARLSCTSRFGPGVYLHSNKHVTNTPNTDLYVAASQIRLDEMCLALYNGANPNYAKKTKFTDSFVHANVLGNMVRWPINGLTPKRVEIGTRMVLDAGARPNDLAQHEVHNLGPIANRRRTALHMGAMRFDRYAPFIRVLLEYGANPNIVDRNYETPLYHASRSSHISAEIFDLLLNATRDLDRVSSSWSCGLDRLYCPVDTALHQIAEHGDIYHFSKMLQAGAATTITNRVGKTACQLNVDCGDARILVSIYTDDQDVNDIGPDGLAQLHKAARDLKRDLVEQLLAISGVNPQIETTMATTDPIRPVGSTPLDFVPISGEDARAIRRSLRRAVLQCGIDPHYDCD